MSMAPEVQSSSFSGNNYSSGPALTPQAGVGTGQWFKEHALFILLAVISLVAILWYLSRKGGLGAPTLSPDTGYPLGYPSVGTGASGGSGASSGGSGGGTTPDTGTGSTASDQAIKDFMAGFNLRDGQVNPAGNTAPSPSPLPVDVHVTLDPLSSNLTATSPTSPQSPISPSNPPGTTQQVNRTPTPTYNLTPAQTVHAIQEIPAFPISVFNPAPKAPPKKTVKPEPVKKPKQTTPPKKTDPRRGGRGRGLQD